MITVNFGRWRAVLVLLVAAVVWAFSLLSPVSAAEETPRGTIPSAGGSLFIPLVEMATSTPREPVCPTESSRSYTLIPVDGPPTDHPDALHGDLNLSLRGYVEVDAAHTLVNVNGPADPNAPQLYDIFADRRTPAFISTQRVHGWDWSCGEHGCRSAELTPREVTLLGMAMAPGETVSIPSRGPQIYGGGYTAMVLYAEEERITLGYTRRDSVAPGYAVHLEQVCVDPNLLALYRQANADGRHHLPALRNGEVLGTAQESEVLVAVRDRGTFMEPRSRKDWWKGR